MESGWQDCTALGHDRGVLQRAQIPQVKAAPIDAAVDRCNIRRVQLRQTKRLGAATDEAGAEEPVG